MRWMDAPVWRRHVLGAGWGDVEPDALVWISIAALDMAWRDSDEYIGEAGRGSQQGDRYARFGRWLEAATFVDVPVLSLDDYGVPVFTDGRHRFAWMRDHGLLSLPIEVPLDEASIFEARFGTAEQFGIVL